MTMSTVLLWSQEPAWEDVSFVIPVIVICPSCCKTGATYPPTIMRICMWVWDAPQVREGPSYPPTLTSVGPEWTLRHCWNVTKVWDSFVHMLTWAPKPKYTNQPWASHQLRNIELVGAWPQEPATSQLSVFWDSITPWGFSLFFIWGKK